MLNVVIYFVSFSYVFSRHSGIVAKARHKTYIPQNANGKMWNMCPLEFTLNENWEGKCEGQKACYDAHKKTGIITHNKILFAKRQKVKNIFEPCHIKSFMFAEV